MTKHKLGSIPLIGGVIAAIAASACCIGPLVLVMLGVGGAWIGSLSALEPFRPFFLAVSLVFLLLSYRRIYQVPAAVACEPGSLCAMPHTNLIYKGLFWVVALLIGLALVFPYLAPFFY